MRYIELDLALDPRRSSFSLTMRFEQPETEREQQRTLASGRAAGKLVARVCKHPLRALCRLLRRQAEAPEHPPHDGVLLGEDPLEARVRDPRALARFPLHG